jgi:hypothetical protein
MLVPNQTPTSANLATILLPNSLTQDGTGWDRATRRYQEMADFLDVSARAVTWRYGTYRIAKPLYGLKPYHGFESHPLRQITVRSYPPTSIKIM